MQHVSDAGEDGEYGTLDDVVIDLGGEGHEPFTVVDGGEGDLDGKKNGTIVTEWYVNPDDSQDETFLLTATNVETGEVATTSFTDTLPSDASVDLTELGGIRVFNDALFTNLQIGAGTGVLDPFVRISTNTPTEKGYNTSGRKLEFDENSSPNFTTDLQLSDIPVVVINGIPVLEFQLDINEPNNGAGEYLSLDVIEIYATDSPITDPQAGGGAYNDILSSMDPLWQLDTDDTPGDDWVALNYALQSGSGVADMVMYVPLEFFDDLEQDAYITFYSEFGLQGIDDSTDITYNWINDSGFEEWSVREFIKISGYKFNDLDGDGVWDTGDGEEGLGGWTIYIDENGNNELDEGETFTVTDEDGFYQFSLFEDGVYTIREEIPEGSDWVQTAPPGGEHVLELSIDDRSTDNNFGNFMPDPSVQIVKLTNGADNNNPTGPYVAVGETVTFTYEVTNTGNVALENVVVTDDNGTPGDTGDDFSPTFVGGDTNGNGLLDLTETWTYTATHTVTADQYTNLGEVCADDPYGSEVCDDDPDNHFGVDSSIDIEKTTNGQQADNPTGPLIAVGGAVNWQYIVTNDGNVDLDNVVVVDSDDVTVTRDDSTDVGSDNILSVGESWTYNASGVAVADQYGNTGTVTADDTLDEEVTDNDPSHYFGVDSSIDIEKATNGEDADNPTGPLIAVGGAALFTYEVTNTGNVPLANVVVVDDNGTPGDTSDDFSPTFTGGDDGNGLLEDGETWTYEASRTVTAGQYTNIAKVTADDPLENEVMDDDPSNHFGEEPDDPDGLAQTPGFWKNHIEIFDQELYQWDQAEGPGDMFGAPGSTPPPKVASEQRYEDVFGVELFGNGKYNNMDLESALDEGGGHQDALLRSSTAALANAASDDLNYVWNDDVAFEIGIVDVFGLDPVLDAAEIDTLRGFYQGIAEDIDVIVVDGVISFDEVINAVRDLYSDTLPGETPPPVHDDFDFEGDGGKWDVGELALTFDILNNMPSAEFEDFA